MLIVLLVFSMCLVVGVLGFVVAYLSKPGDTYTSSTTNGVDTTSVKSGSESSGTKDLPISDGPISCFTFNGEPTENNANLTVNGIKCQGYKFEYGTTRSEGTAVFKTSYWWFTAKGNGPVKCVLQTSGPWVPTNRAYVGSGGTTIDIQVSGSTVTFTLPKPNAYFYKPNVLALNATNSPETIHIYYDSDLVLVRPPNATIVKSGQYANLNVSGTVYLEPGTVIRGSGSGGQFVTFSNGSTLIGAAIIDTNNLYSNICNITGSNINIMGPMFRKSQSFGFVVAGSNIQASFIKVFSGVDGNDAISADTYTISKSSVVAVDDASCMKSNRGRSCKNITVNDCIFSSRKSSLKLGTESPLSFENIKWENITVYDGCRLISLYLVDGGPASNVTFKNVIGFLIPWQGESRSGRWLDTSGAAVASVSRPQQNSPLRNCVIENIYVHGVKDAVVTPTGTPFQITLRNARLVGNAVNLNGLTTSNISTTDIWPIKVV